MKVTRPPVGRRWLIKGLLAALAVNAPLATQRPAAADASTDLGGRWVCTDADCDPYIYDPAVGDPDNIANPDHPIPPGTPFEDLPDDWLCPFCGSPKSVFIPYREPVWN